MNTPPKLPLRFFRWFCHPKLLKYIEGDLMELYEERKVKSGKQKADTRFVIDVLLLFRPAIIKPVEGYQNLNTYGMYKSYFKIGWRSLLRQKLYAIINIGGLTLGLACFIAILLYVQHEFSYDRFYPNTDRIYRVYQQQEGNVFMGTDFFAVTPAKLASVMMDECPEVTHATTVTSTSGLLTIGDNSFWQDGLAADHKFFNVFQLPFISGNPKTALADGQSIVLTQSLAKTIFGTQDPIGQSFRYQNGEEDYTVTAIVADPPATSSIKYSFIIHLLYNKGYAEELKRSGWNNNSFYTFFELIEDGDRTVLEKKFETLIKKYQLPEDYADYPFKDKYFIQPLTEAYFQSGINFDIGQKGNINVIYAYSVVALIVLLLACVNYMNLAIARSIKRASEVGLRKVVGAVRSQLIGQFLGESVFISLISLILAVGFTYTVLPYFGTIVERPIEFNLLLNTWLLPTLLLLVLVVGLLSGSYPALVMSGLKPIEVLKTKLNAKVSGFSLQRFLIVFQFTSSLVLVICSVVIYRQLNFMKEKELGFDKEDVVTIQVKDRALLSKFQILSNEWLQHSNVVATTLSSHLPMSISSSTLIRKHPSDKDKLAIYQWSVEDSFLDVFGVQLIAGRNFSDDLKMDGEESFIINETAARALGWTPQEAVGQQVDYDGPKTIIGVVNDFHMLSMHLPIQPLMIRYADTRGRFISLKIKHENIPQTLAFIGQVFKKNSVYPFEYEFLSDTYSKLYNSELKLGEVFGFFTIVCMVIASLGLFGLAAFMTGQRTKEIGVRKVFGASTQSIVFMLSKNILLLVLVSFAIAIPLGWYSMNLWLQDFAYRVNIGWWTFAWAGILALFIANISIGYQSIRASLANPAESLKQD